MQCGAGKLDQWQRYMTGLVVYHGIIKSISTLTVVIHPMIKYDVDTQWDCFHQKVKWREPIR